ncbi:MAG: GNAT family N-acetyltransferase [Chloroflexota bacterium]
MLNTTADLIYHIEELAANAWPSSITQVVDGWRLRFNEQVTRRANSVWPNALGAQHDLTDSLNWVEDFYQQRGCPPRYQICPAAQPANLDEILADRGYVADARTAVQIAPISTVLAHTQENFSNQVTVRELFDERWFQAYCEAEDVGDHEASGRRQILARIAPQVGYALLTLEGQPAAMGLAVVERGWVGIFSMATQPAFRRRGLATSVIRALAIWGQEKQATQFYLQVMESNTVAQTLYQKLGFETLYHYHYREKKDA